MSIEQIEQIEHPSIAEEIKDPEAEERAQKLEAVRELNNWYQSALAEYYKGDPEQAAKRQLEIDDLLKQSLEGDFPGISIALVDDDGKAILYHPDEIVEPGHCYPNRVSVLGERVSFTDAYGRMRTIITNSPEEAKEKLKELEARGFEYESVGDRRNQVLVDSNSRGDLVRIDHHEQGKYPRTQDAVNKRFEYPFIDQGGRVTFGIRAGDGYTYRWDDPSAPWNLEEGIDNEKL